MDLILFGAGHYGKDALSYFGEKNVYCFSDNKVKGTDEIEVCGKKVISFERFMEVWQDHIVVVCLKLEFCLEVCKQLEDAGVRGYIVYEALLDEKKTSDEWMEQLRDKEEREKIQRKSFLFMLDKAMAQFQYLRYHADITALKPATGQLRNRQLKLIEEAQEFFDFIKELDIKPFLTYGNLIGAVRHQGFVPWDDDLDFGLIRNEYEKLLEFAYEKCAVLTYEPDKDIWVDGNGNVTENCKICTEFQDKYVFNLRRDMIQVLKCSREGCIWVMDIWAYDFYKNEYAIEDYTKWITQMNEEVLQKDSSREQMIFIRKAIKNNPMISREMTDHFFPGLDNFRGYPGEREIESWIPTRHLLPLQKVKYENTEFWAPHDMEAVLRYEYIDYMKFPDNVGIMTHEGMKAD